MPNAENPEHAYLDVRPERCRGEVLKGVRPHHDVAVEQRDQRAALESHAQPIAPAESEISRARDEFNAANQALLSAERDGDTSLSRGHSKFSTDTAF